MLYVYSSVLQCVVCRCKSAVVVVFSRRVVVTSTYIDALVCVSLLCVLCFFWFDWVSYQTRSRPVDRNGAT